MRKNVLFERVFTQSDVPVSTHFTSTFLKNTPQKPPKAAKSAKFVILPKRRSSGNRAF